MRRRVIMALVTAIAATMPSAARANEGARAGGGPLAVLAGIVAEGGVDVTRGIAYGAHPRQKLDVYEPPVGAPRRRPVLLFFYGGSWTSGDRGVYAFVGAAFARRGYTTVIADYRLHPEVQFPTFVEDGARAYGWVANGPAQACGGGRPIHLMGHSAGAHIAALIALDSRYLARHAASAPRPAGFIGLSGPYAFDPTTWPETAPIFATTAADPDRARPLAQARRGVPPTLLLHGLADDVVPPRASEVLATTLAGQGVDVTRVEYGLVGHIGLVTAIARPLRWRADVVGTTVAFLERTTRAADATPCAR